MENRDICLMHVCIHTNVFAARGGGNNHDTSGPCFFNWSHTSSWYVYLTSSTESYMFLFFCKLLSWLWFYTWWGDQTFIHEGSWPLLLLLGSGCCTSSSTLITGHGDIPDVHFLTSTVAYLSDFPLVMADSLLDQPLVRLVNFLLDPCGLLLLKP